MCDDTGFPLFFFIFSFYFSTVSFDGGGGHSQLMLAMDPFLMETDTEAVVKVALSQAIRPTESLPPLFSFSSSSSLSFSFCGLCTNFSFSFSLTHSSSIHSHLTGGLGSPFRRYLLSKEKEKERKRERNTR